MSKIKTPEPSPDRSSQNPLDALRALYEQGQEAVSDALDALKGNVSPSLEPAPTAPASAPSGRAVAPAGQPPTAPAASAPRQQNQPEATQEPLQQALEYIKHMPHSAVIALASMTVSAWLFSQPREDDGVIVKSLRTLLRWGGAGVLGAWAWQKYGSELMATQSQEKDRPATRPSKRSGEAPNKTGIEVEQLPSGGCLLWVDDHAYQVSKSLAKLTSFTRQGDAYALSGSVLAISGKAYFPAAELERVGQMLREKPGVSIKDCAVVGSVKKADFPTDIWEAIVPMIQKDERNQKMSDSPEEWSVHTTLSFTFIPPTQ